MLPCPVSSIGCVGLWVVCSETFECSPMSIEPRHKDSERKYIHCDRMVKKHNKLVESLLQRVVDEYPPKSIKNLCAKFLLCTTANRRRSSNKRPVPGFEVIVFI